MSVYEAFTIYIVGVSFASMLAIYLLHKNNNATFENSFYATIMSLWGSWITFVIFILIFIIIKNPQNRKTK